MAIRFLSVGIVVLLACSTCPLAADEPPAGELAVVEVHGMLGLRDDTDKGKNVYKVTFGTGKKVQLYHLVLPDDEAIQKAAKALVGQPVTVTGNLEIKQVWDFKSREGKQLLVGEIKVKSLKRTEAPGK
jgi:hypothetical protein